MPLTAHLGHAEPSDLRARAGEPGEDLMTDVIDRLAVAMNAHDLDAVAGLIHEDYRSEQPAHPSGSPGLGHSKTGRRRFTIR